MLSSTSAFADNISLPLPKPIPGEVDVGAAVSPMRKGQIAPFTGVLMSPKATASIIVELNSISTKIQIEVNKVKSEDKAYCDSRVNEANITAETRVKIMQATIDFNTKERKILEDRLKREESSSPNVALWAGGGFVIGVATTVLTVFAINKASN